MAKCSDVDSARERGRVNGTDKGRAVRSEMLAAEMTAHRSGETAAYYAGFAEGLGAEVERRVAE